MPRRARQAPGGIVYHALNRAVARSPLLAKAADYAAFLRVWLRHWTNAPCAFLPLVSAADFAGEMGPIEHYANSRGITGRAGLRPSRSGQARVRADLPKLFENSLYLRQDRQHSAWRTLKTGKALVVSPCKKMRRPGLRLVWHDYDPYATIHSPPTAWLAHCEMALQ